MSLPPPPPESGLKALKGLDLDKVPRMGVVPVSSLPPPPPGLAWQPMPIVVHDPPSMPLPLDKDGNLKLPDDPDSVVNICVGCGNHVAMRVTKNGVTKRYTGFVKNGFNITINAKA